MDALSIVLCDYIQVTNIVWLANVIVIIVCNNIEELHY